MNGERLAPLAGAAVALLMAAQRLHPLPGSVYIRAGLERVGAVLIGFGIVWLVIFPVLSWWQRRRNRPPVEISDNWWLVGVAFAASALTGALNGQLKLPKVDGVDWLFLKLAVSGIAGGFAAAWLAKLLRR